MNSHAGRGSGVVLRPRAALPNLPRASRRRHRPLVPNTLHPTPYALHPRPLTPHIPDPPQPHPTPYVLDTHMYIYMYIHVYIPAPVALVVRPGTALPHLPRSPCRWNRPLVPPPHKPWHYVDQLRFSTNPHSVDPAPYLTHAHHHQHQTLHPTPCVGI